MLKHYGGTVSMLPAQDPSESTDDTEEIITSTEGLDPTSAVTAIILIPSTLIDLTLQLHLRCEEAWLHKFRQESTDGKALMLISLLSGFSDGQDGVKVAFEDV